MRCFNEAVQRTSSLQFKDAQTQTLICVGLKEQRLSLLKGGCGGHQILPHNPGGHREVQYSHFRAIWFHKRRAPWKDGLMSFSSILGSLSSFVPPHSSVHLALSSSSSFELAGEASILLLVENTQIKASRWSLRLFLRRLQGRFFFSLFCIVLFRIKKTHQNIKFCRPLSWYFLSLALIAKQEHAGIHDLKIFSLRTHHLWTLPPERKDATIAF